MRRTGSGSIDPRPTVAIQEVVDPRAGAAKLAVGRRDVGLQRVEAARALRAVIDSDPDARLVRHDLATALIRSAAGPVAKLLRARLRAHVLEMAQHAVAARLAPEERLLDRELDPLDEGGGGLAAIDPREHMRERPAKPGVTTDRQGAPEPVEDPPRHCRPLRWRARGEIEAAGGAVAELRGQRLPLGCQLVGSTDDPGDVGRVVSAADVGPGVAETAQDRHGSCGALEPGLPAAVAGAALGLYRGQKLGRDPAARRPARRHPLRRLGPEDVDVAEKGRAEPALVEIALELREFLRVPADLRDGDVRAGGDLLLELDVLIDAVRLGVFEGRNRHGDVKGHAAPPALADETHELDGVEVEDRRLIAGARIVAGQGEDVLERQRVHVVEALREPAAVLAHARQVDVGRQPARARGGGDAQGIGAHRTAGVTRDAARYHRRDASQPRGRFEQPRLTRQRRGDELDDVAEAPRRQRVPQRVGHPWSSRRTSCAPSTMAPSLAKATSRGRWSRPQSGLTDSRSTGRIARASRIRSATTAAGSTSWVLTSTTPSPSVNGASNSLKSRRSSLPRRANSRVIWWIRASRTAGN